MSHVHFVVTASCSLKGQSTIDGFVGLAHIWTQSELMDDGQADNRPSNPPNHAYEANSVIVRYKPDL